MTIKTGTDLNMDPVMDLSPETLLAACKGDVSKLPGFVVHSDESWPWHTQVRPAKGDLHMRRTTFNRVVAPQVPVKPGLWIGPDTQRFSIDLQPHQLQGPEDQALLQPGGKNHEAARRLAAADEAGRLPDEEDYGAEAVERRPGRNVEREDLERVAADPERAGVGSGVFSGVRDTEPVSVGGDD